MPIQSGIDKPRKIFIHLHESFTLIIAEKKHLNRDLPFQSGIGKPGQKKNYYYQIERQNFRLKPLSEDPHPPAVNQLFFKTASQHIFKFPGVFDKIAFIKPNHYL